MSFPHVRFVLFISLFQVLFCPCLCGQTTIRPSVASQDNDWVIESISITDNQTIVNIHVPSQPNSIRIPSKTILSWEDVFPISEARSYRVTEREASWYYKNTRISDERVEQLIKYFDTSGLLLRGAENIDVDRYEMRPKTKKDQKLFSAGKPYSQPLDITLYFDALPKGIETVYIKTFTWASSLSTWKYHNEWVGIKINNPWPESYTIDASEIYSLIDAQNDGIVGIYEGTNSQGSSYTLACVRDKENYKIVYMDSKTPEQSWHRGEIKCDLYPSATPGLFKGDWYLRNKRKAPNCFVSFDGSFMSAIVNGVQEQYVKMYPTAGSIITSSQWSGSGFAINKNLIVTNHHVIEGATSIKVIGINGNHETEYSASVVAKDKNNDLAIIKLDEGQGAIMGIPYSVDFRMAEVGQDIFVLGYPLITTMGEEVKYTNGSISSKSGFEGDISTYQISAPIQPGNSGGPLFDSKGNVIGIVNAKHTGADNAGYAIKTSYLKALIENAELGNVVPNGNTIPQGDRTQQIEKLRNFVYLIKCIGK